jgi:hypothetical protein
MPGISFREMFEALDCWRESDARGVAPSPSASSVESTARRVDLRCDIPINVAILNIVIFGFEESQ